MTDLSLFKFITYFSSQKEFDFSNNDYIDHTDHDFILLEKFGDNSGAKVKCNKCNIEAFVAKRAYNELYFYFWNLSKKNKYSCNELIIKQIIE